jgi:zinc transport system ATP-binding protein
MIPRPCDHCPAIEVQRCCFGYKACELILEDASFSICPKQTVACIGPNGGGKTTLLRLLLGFLRPQSGCILLNGRTPHEMRSQVAYVPQVQRHDKLFPISVQDVVLMGLLRELSWTGRFSQAQRQRAAEALSWVGLEPLLHQSFGSLSGGQAQRVLIARALISNPEFLFLDEPTSSVDPAAEAQIFDLLEQLRGSRNIFLVTHDLQTAHHHVDFVLCVHRRVDLMAPRDLCGHFSLGLYHRLQPVTQR